MLYFDYLSERSPMEVRGFGACPILFPPSPIRLIRFAILDDRESVLECRAPSGTEKCRESLRVSGGCFDPAGDFLVDPDNESAGAVESSGASSSSLAFGFVTMLIKMQIKTTTPETQPIMMLILLLSTNFILAGSIGVWISVHLLLCDPRLTMAGFNTKRPVSFELG